MVWSTILLFFLFSPVFAIQENEAGVIDWHKPFIGVPLTSSHATSPSFHRVTSKESTTQSVVLAVTEENVLGALEPISGNLTWRYIFREDDTVVRYEANNDVVVTLSGPGGSILRTFDVLSGDLITESKLHDVSNARRFDPAHLGSQLAFSHDGADVFVLTNGNVLQRRNPQTGATLWTWTASEKQTQSNVYSQIVVSLTDVYLIGLGKSGSSYVLQVESISPSSGEVVASARVPSNIHNGLTDFLVLSQSSKAAASQIVWLEKESIHTFELGSELKAKPKTLSGVAVQSIKDVGLCGQGQFVGVKKDGSFPIFKLQADGSVQQVGQFAALAEVDSKATPIFSGGLDKTGNPYIGRYYYSDSLKRATAQVFGAHMAEGKGMLIGYTFLYDPVSFGELRHVALDAANPKPHQIVSRFVVTTSTGAVQLWQHDKQQWTREESLSNIVVAELIELPERQAAQAHPNLHTESFVQKMLRQAEDAKSFPLYVIKFIRRFATGSYASIHESATVSPSSNSTASMYRESFGFRKVIVAATSKGTVFALDSSNGAVIWKRVLGLGWAAAVGGHHDPLKLFVTRTVSEGETPQIVLLTERTADNTLQDTVLFHLEALTGEDVTKTSKINEILEGFDIAQSAALDTFMMPEDKTVIVVDTLLQVYLYPDTPDTRTTFSKIASSLHFPLRSGGRILGHRINPQIETTGRFTAYSTWITKLPPGESILSVTPRPYEPVASYGKVLANRTTLYKYLNPNLVAVTTLSKETKDVTCGVYLVDGAKGAIVYHATIPSVVGACDVKATLTENWLVYTYYEDGASQPGGAKGYRIVSVELYEGEKIDDKTSSSDASPYSKEASAISVYEQSFVFPHAVTAITTTSTKYGITQKDILVANHKHQVQSFPRRALDPRRPHTKPTSEEQSEEWLFQYDPIIPDDPRRIISHKYQVAKIRQILTSPAFLESTSLVFAFGLDLFSSRIAPSNTFDVLSDNFNKAQLVLTVMGLGAAIAVTRPMVQTKRLKERWYQ